jgi:hypothetical protein
MLGMELPVNHSVTCNPQSLIKVRNVAFDADNVLQDEKPRAFLGKRGGHPNGDRRGIGGDNKHRGLRTI